MSEHWTDCGDCGWHLKVPEAFRPGWVLCVQYGHETHVHGGCVWGKDVEPIPVAVSEEEARRIDGMFIDWDTFWEKDRERHDA